MSVPNGSATRKATRVGGFWAKPRTVRLVVLSNDRFGYAGSFYEVTIGANWKYSANTTIRPYVRFDWFSGDSLNATPGDPNAALRQRYWQQPDPHRWRHRDGLLTKISEDARNNELQDFA